MNVTPALGDVLPLWSVVPFACMLLAIAVLPMALPHVWESNRVRGIVAGVLGLPIVIWMLQLSPHTVAHTALEYASFIILLGSLYVTSSGIVVRGRLPGKPLHNAAILAVGATLASIIGTTGASMLLIRPLLRANAARPRIAHVVVFFIFVVSNIGGLLTPLGDPPLFLGFLAGVPFGWPFRLLPMWATANGLLILMFFLLDTAVARKEPPFEARPLEPLRLEGTFNGVMLLALIGVLLGSAHFHLPTGCQEAGMLAVTAIAYFTTPKQLRHDNAFSWEPLIEVVVIFAGIFATMMPALAILNARGAQLGVTEPWQFFWLTGLLSSLLDNAPTYLTFTATASALLHTDAQQLSELLRTPAGEALLRAISLGAVMMGANTYVGNGPNFMVKAIADKHGVTMPNFFGYMGYSVVFLGPIYGLLTLVLF